MSTTNIILTAIVTAIATVAIRILAGGFAVMLLLGVVWHQFGLLEPLGFTESVWLALAITFVQIAFTVNANLTVDQEG